MIVHLVGNFQGQSLRFELEEGVHRVGRGRPSEIWLRDPSVSREHAEIRLDAAGLGLRDL
jgi:pSer/pThr/pTyr-binding forkhead associated (FHA) protein